MIGSVLIFAVVFGVLVFSGFLLFGGGNVVKTRIETAVVSDTNTGRTARSKFSRGGGQQKQREAFNRVALEHLRERERSSRNFSLIPVLTRKIQQAGYTFSPQIFLLGIGGMFFVLGLVIYYYTGNMVISSGIALVLSCFVPVSVLNMSIRRRQARFIRALPDALDLMVRGVKSGLPLNESIQAVASEGSGPVGEEFSNILEKLVVGMSLEEVLEGLYERMPLPEVNFMRIVLSIQHKSGGNISEALSNLSGVLRSRSTMKKKISAITSEARASSVIIGLLPLVMAGVMTLASPGYLDPLFQTEVGHKVLTGAFVMFSLGIFTLVQMMNIKQ